MSNPTFTPTLTKEQESLVANIAQAHSLQTAAGWNKAWREVRKALPKAAHRVALVQLNAQLGLQIHLAIQAGRAVTLSHSCSGSVTSIITLEQLGSGLVVRQRYYINNRAGDGAGDCVYAFNHPMVAQLEKLYGFYVADGQAQLKPVQ